MSDSPARRCSGLSSLVAAAGRLCPGESASLDGGGAALFPHVEEPPGQGNHSERLGPVGRIGHPAPQNPRGGTESPEVRCEGIDLKGLGIFDRVRQSGSRAQGDRGQSELGQRRPSDRRRQTDRRHRGCGSETPPVRRGQTRRPPAKRCHLAHPGSRRLTEQATRCHRDQTAPGTARPIAGGAPRCAPGDRR